MRACVRACGHPSVSTSIITAPDRPTDRPIALHILTYHTQYMETVAESFESISFLLKQLQAKGNGVSLEQIFKDFDTDGKRRDKWRG